MAERSASADTGPMQINGDLAVATSAPVMTFADGGRLFDPADGDTVMAPVGSGPGWWVGAPSALWTGGRFYLSYRERRPQPHRGGATTIAVSEDGRSFEPIWRAAKDDFGSPSIERCCLVQVGREWRLYVSYVDPADGRWRIDLLEAATPDTFDPSRRREVLTADDIGAEGVKDPWIARCGDHWLMIASYASAPTAPVISRQQLHGTQDVYNTGLTKSLSGLALSDDGVNWRWQGAILVPSEGGWDSYAARLTAVIGSEGAWIGFYDGSQSVAQNYEERCGIVTSADLRTWTRRGDGPLIGAAGGPGTVRYVEAVQTDQWIRYFYEYTCADGSHQLRTQLVEHARRSAGRTDPEEPH